MRKMIVCLLALLLLLPGCAGAPESQESLKTPDAVETQDAPETPPAGTYFCSGLQQWARMRLNDDQSYSFSHGLESSVLIAGSYSVHDGALSCGGLVFDILQNKELRFSKEKTVKLMEEQRKSALSGGLPTDAVFVCGELPVDFPIPDGAVYVYEKHSGGFTVSTGD